MLRRLHVLMLMFLSAGVTWGQSSPPPDQAEQVRILLERVQQLEKRVNELEAKQPAASPVQRSPAKWSGTFFVGRIAGSGQNIGVLGVVLLHETGHEGAAGFHF